MVALKKMESDMSGKSSTAKQTLSQHLHHKSQRASCVSPSTLLGLESDIKNQQVIIVHSPSWIGAHDSKKKDITNGWRTSTTMHNCILPGRFHEFFYFDSCIRILGLMFEIPFKKTTTVVVPKSSRKNRTFGRLNRPTFGMARPFPQVSWPHPSAATHLTTA